MENTNVETTELIEEREEEIAFFESELLDYQEKRFGALFLDQDLLMPMVTHRLRMRPGSGTNEALEVTEQTAMTLAMRLILLVGTQTKLKKF